MDIDFDGFTDLMLRAIRGENMFVPPAPERVPPPLAPVLEKALAVDAALANLRAWLAPHGR